MICYLFEVFFLPRCTRLFRHPSETFGRNRISENKTSFMIITFVQFPELDQIVAEKSLKYLLESPFPFLYIYSSVLSLYCFSWYRYMPITNISQETRKITSTDLLWTTLSGLFHRYSMTRWIFWNETLSEDNTN